MLEMGVTCLAQSWFSESASKGQTPLFHLFLPCFLNNIFFFFRLENAIWFVQEHLALHILGAK